MNMNNRFSVTFLSVLCLLCGYYWELSHSNQEDNFIRMMAKPGGLRDCLHGSQNSAMLDNLARFAVQEHNKKQNALLEFVRVVEAKEQVVAGKLYHLTLVAMDAGNEVMYKAKVWVKPWMNFKQLEEFKHVGSGSSFTASDLGIKQGH